MPNALLTNIKLRIHYFIDILKFIFGKNGLSARHRRFGICGLFIIISSIIFLNVIFPVFLETIIQKETALKKGWFMRKVWRKLPFAYEFRVYVFNVSNPEEIGQGGKPIVREIGPFVYDVWQVKTNIEDHETDDTLTYSVNNTYFFNQEKSRCLTDKDELTLPHFISLGIPIAVMKSKPTLLPIASKAVDVVMNKPDSVFVKMSVDTLLFGGFVVDCNGMEDFFGKALCNEMKETWYQYRMMKLGDNIYAYSIFGAINATDNYSGQSRIRRGIKDIKEVGELIEHNHMKYLSIWQNDECDALHGTEGTFFHPFLEKRKNLYVTHTFFCRSLMYQYESSVKFAELKLFRYTTSLGTKLNTDPKDKCYCTWPENCLKDGVYDLWKCHRAAYTISNPHFYLADPYYVKAVHGVRPVKAKHQMILDIDPLTGWPVRAHFRFQLNYQLMKLPKYRMMKTFPEALLPVLWVDQVAVLPNIYLDRIVHFYKTIIIARLLTVLGIFFGLILGSITGFHEYRLYKTRKNQKKVMKKYASKWKMLAKKNEKRKMGISLRTIRTLRIMQRNQIAAAAAGGDTRDLAGGDTRDFHI